MTRTQAIFCFGLVALALSGCEKKTWTHDEIQDIAADVADDVVSDSQRISALESRIEELESKLGMQQSAISQNEALASAVAKQVAYNAKVANENVLAAATKRGACGYQTVTGPGNPPGWIRREPVVCTDENYFDKNDGP